MTKKIGDLVLISLGQEDGRASAGILIGFQTDRTWARTLFDSGCNENLRYPLGKKFWIGAGVRIGMSPEEWEE